MSLPTRLPARPPLPRSLYLETTSRCAHALSAAAPRRDYGMEG